jgi:protein involved in polysaccharide export with SLBB domain
MKHTVYGLILLCLLLLPVSLAFPQTDSGGGSGASIGAGASSPSDLTRIAAELRVQMAIASPDYRVTAGDVYSLAFLAGTSPVTYVIAIDSSYRVRVANLGIIDAAGKTYMQLKSQVEAIVSNNYPLSGVQFVLTRPSVFRVHVQGEVTSAGEREAWALDRLSSLISGGLTLRLPGRTALTDDTPPGRRVSSGFLTHLASLRDVTIRSVGGQVRTYDLFKAWRSGDLSQDPYLRPGDTVTFNRVTRSVIINGEVERPGTYPIQDGENLKELIELYGSGFTAVADKTRIELVRYVNSTSVSGDKIFLNENSVYENYALQDYDVVTVPRIAELRPVVFIEGAVGAERNSAAPTVATKLMITFNRGEYYSALVRTNRHWFSAVSDTENAYIIRDGGEIPINLNPMLYDADFHNEVLIKENDTLIIPFRQYFVTVAGAVLLPGRYPYIPDRSWDYYIALAGGFVPGRNFNESITITDITGRRLRKTDVITPETIITAKTNDFLYYFNQYAPVITTLLSIVTTFLTATTLINR